MVSGSFEPKCSWLNKEFFPVRIFISLTISDHDSISVGRTSIKVNDLFMWLKRETFPSLSKALEKESCLYVWLFAKMQSPKRFITKLHLISY